MDEQEYERWETEVLDNVHDQGRPFQERWADDTGSLMNDLFSLRGHGNQVGVELDYSRPVQALLVDGAVRYGYNGDTLVRYVFELLGAGEGLNLFSQDEIATPPDLAEIR